MAKRVIDDLEAVEIEAEHCRALFRIDALANSLTEALRIEKSGKLIMRGKVLQFCFARAPDRDVSACAPSATPDAVGQAERESSIGTS